MTIAPVVNHYEALEISPNANAETIDRVFRYLAQQYHPDVAETGDNNRFSQIVEAYEVLKNPESRADYDQELKSIDRETEQLVNESGTAESDTALRHRLLTLFYAKRKKDMKEPGIGVATLEQAFEIPHEILNFHLWYFREKGLIKREESGLLSITAEGVDKIEERVLSGQAEILAVSYTHLTLPTKA